VRLERLDLPGLDQRRYMLTIEGGDLAAMRLRPGDLLLLGECNRPDASIADGLLALELMARRIEDSNQRSSPDET